MKFLFWLGVVLVIALVLVYVLPVYWHGGNVFTLMYAIEGLAKSVVAR